jgi:hypothetical protein
MLHFCPIMTIYFGKIAAREPFDEMATQDDLDFWNSHALIYRRDQIIEESESEVFTWELNSPSICRVKISTKKQPYSNKEE